MTLTGVRLRLRRWLRTARVSRHEAVLRPALERLESYLLEMRRRRQRIGVLIDTPETKAVLGLTIRCGIVSPTNVVITAGVSPPPECTGPIHTLENLGPDDIDGLVVPRLAWNDDRRLNELVNTLGTLGLPFTVYDQMPAYGGTWREDVPTEYLYRNITFLLGPDSVIPSYYANHRYIELLLARIRAWARPIAMLDLCAGQGVVGLCCYKDADGGVDLVANAELHSGQAACIEATARHNDLDPKRVLVFQSDTFAGVPSELRFDLITANPPHADAPAPRLIDRQGNDPNWDFHRKLFRGAAERLTDEGIVCLIENGRPGYGSVETFAEIIADERAGVELVEHAWIRGSEWFVMFLRKRGYSHGRRTA